MKRTALRPRQKPPKRSRIKKHPRKKSERERIYGPKGYIEWIHQQPCIACGVVGYSECAHIKTGGTGRKDDWTRTVPLCGKHPIRVNPYFPGHHQVLHNIGRVTFEGVYGLDLGTSAVETHSRWLSFSGGSPKTGRSE